MSKIDDIPDWAGSRVGPQTLSGIERLREIVQMDPGRAPFGLASSHLTVLQAREIMAALTTTESELAGAMDTLKNVHMSARRGLAFGRQATQQTPERMIARRDMILSIIVGMCEEAGINPPTLLREDKRQCLPVRTSSVIDRARRAQGKET